MTKETDESLAAIQKNTSLSKELIPMVIKLDEKKVIVLE
jgi:hypothetical protein